MDISRDIHKALQCLERKGLISRLQRLGYLDLLTYADNFEYFTVRTKELAKILNLRESNTRKIVRILEEVGLLEKKIVTDVQEKRSYGNCLSIKLEKPEKVLSKHP